MGNYTGRGEPIVGRLSTLQSVQVLLYSRFSAYYGVKEAKILLGLFVWTVSSLCGCLTAK